MPQSKKSATRPHRGLFQRLRAYFFTGLVVAAPIGITVYLTWWFVSLFDTWIKPYVPSDYNPDNYLPFSVPGVGLLLALFGITMVGALTANLFGRTILSYWETLLNRMPVVRNVYSALKQIFETVLSQRSNSFSEVCLIEYPRKGLYAIAFVSTDTTGEIPNKVNAGELSSVFLPTTPNPTSGFLLFVPVRDMIRLDMTVEEAAKLVISAGLVVPEFDGTVKKNAVPQITEETAREIVRSRKKKTSDAAE
jgi:uncharacterized membrane protein